MIIALGKYCDCVRDTRNALKYVTGQGERGEGREKKSNKKKVQVYFHFLPHVCSWSNTTNKTINIHISSYRGLHHVAPKPDD